MTIFKKTVFLEKMSGWANVPGWRRQTAFTLIGFALLLRFVVLNEPPRPAPSNLAVAGGVVILAIIFLALGPVLRLLYPVLFAVGKVPGWRIVIVIFLVLMLKANRVGFQYYEKQK